MTTMLDSYEMPDDVRRSIDRAAAEALFPQLRTGSGSGSARTKRPRPRWWSAAATGRQV